MNDRHLTIQDVSDSTGISRNTISQLYNGKSRGIQFDTLSKLTNGLQASTYDLFIDDVDINDLVFDLDFVEDYKLDFNNIRGNYSDEEFGEAIFFNKANSHEEYTIVEFRLPLQVRLVKKETFTALFFYSSEDFLDDMDYEKNGRMDYFLRQTELKKVESFLFDLINAALDHIDIENLNVDLVYYVTDIGVINDERNQYLLNFYWPYSFFKNIQTFYEYLSLKY